LSPYVFNNDYFNGSIESWAKQEPKLMVPTVPVIILRSCKVLDPSMENMKDGFEPQVTHQLILHINPPI